MEPGLIHKETKNLTPEQLRQVACDALESMKAVDLTVIDVAEKSSFADWMIVVSGTSQRHVKSLANEVIEQSKKAGNRPLGVEGETDGNWWTSVMCLFTS
jgi:ribosome-associated protein